MRLLIKICLGLVSLGVFFYYVALSFDYVKDIYKISGLISLVCFFLSVLFSFGKDKTLFLVKFLGKLSAFYAFVHFANFLFLDTQFNWLVLKKDILAISNIIGLSALIIMIILLFKKRFDLILTALFLASIHYALSTKAPQLSHYAAVLAAFILLLCIKKAKAKPPEA